MRLRNFRSGDFQRGDTIVEVLICILIVSLVLGGAYTTTRQSSNGVRNSQEHAEALKLVQSQVEQLRSGASSPAPNIFTVADPFCMVDGNPVVGGDPGCDQNRSVQKALADELAYKLTVKRGACPPSLMQCVRFEVRADWDSVTGTPAQETIFYRLYQ